MLVFRAAPKVGGAKGSTRSVAQIGRLAAKVERVSGGTAERAVRLAATVADYEHAPWSFLDLGLDHAANFCV
ncbi:MAG: hypothetical protein ACXWQO_03500 [Bdellovibrionota bacterium]